MEENEVVTLEVDISQAEKGIVKVTKDLTGLKKRGTGDGSEGHRGRFCVL